MNKKKSGKRTLEYTHLTPQFCRGLTHSVLRTGTELEQYSSHDSLHFCLKGILP